MSRDSLDLEGVLRDTKPSLHEAELLERCFAHTLTAEAGRELQVAGSPLSRPKMILSGWVGLARFLDDGRRQFMDLHIAGDFTAFRLQSDAHAQAYAICLTPVQYVEVAEILHGVNAQPGLYPGLLAKMRASEEEQRARLFDHILRVGRMLAHERLAHFALELYRRHERVGLVTAQSFPMPLTQEVLGDVLGLSTVHINRTLQQLRREGLLKTANGRWQIPNIEALRAVAAETREPGSVS